MSAAIFPKSTIPEAQLRGHLADVRRVLAPNDLYIASTLNLEHDMKPGKPYLIAICRNSPAA